MQFTILTGLKEKNCKIISIDVEKNLSKFNSLGWQSDSSGSVPA
jgi:hypothetical protein